MEDGPTLEESNGEVNLPPPPSMQSLLAKMLMDLAKQPRDIWKLSAPAALLNGVSLLEYSQYYGDHPKLLSAIPRSDSPKDRLVACVIWYISTLYGSYGSRSGGKAGGYERKPYNPILGEQFRCWWGTGDDGSDTMQSELVAEQVSHHPPVSAFYIKNGNGVHVHGFTGQSTAFNGTGVRVRQNGRLFVYLEEWREEITITLPELHLFGLASAPYLEITGPTLLLSTSGWAADLDFRRSGYIYGAKDQFNGVIYDNETGIVELDIWGDWKHQVFLADHEAFKEQGKPAGAECFSHDATQFTKPTVRPLDEQLELESRRVWCSVTKALSRADYDGADAAKNVIEERQRRLRREQAEQGIEFEPALFIFTDSFHFLPMCLPDESIDSDEDLTSEEEDSFAPSSSPSSQLSSDSSVSAVPYTGRWLANEFASKFAIRTSK